jgi:hypothetical protein
VNLFSKVKFEWTRARRTLKRTGPGGLFRGVRNAIAGAWFDLSHGVETGALWTRYSWPNGYQGAWEYGPGKISDLKKVLSKLRTIHPEEFIFLDIGSGKGRMLMMASCLPFKQLIGVELSPELYEIGRNNLRKFRSAAQKCRDIVTHCVDANSFPLPPENTVLFLYNPFKAPVMEQFLAHLDQSLRENPREVYFVYAKPLYHDLVMSTGWLQLLSKDGSVAIYQYAPGERYRGREDAAMLLDKE